MHMVLEKNKGSVVRKRKEAFAIITNMQQPNTREFTECCRLFLRVQPRGSDDALTDMLQMIKWFDKIGLPNWPEHHVVLTPHLDRTLLQVPYKTFSKLSTMDWRFGGLEVEGLGVWRLGG